MYYNIMRLNKERYVMKIKNILMRKSMFINIIFCFGIFMVAFTFLMLSTGAIYSGRLRENIVAQHTEALSSSSNVVNENIQKTLNMANMLSQNSSVYNIFYSNQNDVYTDVAQIQNVMETLATFSNASDLIAEVAIVDRKNSVVYSPKGKFSIGNYFGEATGYVEYDEEYWKSKKIPSIGYEVLKPSLHNLVSYSVMPLVTSGFAGNKTEQLLIIDINIDMLSKRFYATGMTELSSIFIYNAEQGIVFGQDEETKGFFENRKFIESLEKKNSFSYKHKGKKYLIVKTDGKIGRNDYYYISIVRINDLLDGFNNIARITWFINICFMFVFVILAYYMSRHLYAPIQGLYSLVSDDSKNKIGKSNEIEILRLKMQEVLDNESSMRRQLQTMFPLVCAQKLREFLESVDDFDEFTGLEHIMHQNGIDFKEDNFVVAIVKMKYSEKFYADFNNEQYLKIRTAIGVFFENVLNAEYNSYAISDKKDEHILIINIPEDESAFKRVVDELKAACEGFKYDNDYIMINIAVGTVGTGYEGMKQSYTESRSMSILQQGSGGSRFDIYTDSHNSAEKFEYTMDDENRLFHCMVKGDVDGAYKIIGDVLQNNIANGIDHFNVRVLYHQFYNTAARVLQTKGVSEKELMQGRYVDINIGFERMDIDYMAEYIRLLVREAAEYTQIVATRIDLDGIIEYIEKNYSEDIYLENIAEKYNTTSKYLSKLLKQHLGVGFGAYLSGLRIDKAKRMLSETDMRINDIYSECGFYSRNTFIRTFKNLVGVLPSDYRKMSKNIDVSTNAIEDE